MTDWRTIKKIDAHIHILPDEVHVANPNSEDVWVYAYIEKYRKIMRRYNIKKAVIMPLNDPWLMSMDFTVSAVHKNLYEMKRKYSDQFYAFADIDTRNPSVASVDAICLAIEKFDLDGIKVHPNNTGVPLDSEYNQAIFAFAQDRKIPVAVHSYPNSETDFCSVTRIESILKRFPDLRMIVSHMGAFQWEQLLHTNTYVDFSAVLPAYSAFYGINRTNEIMRMFGPERLIFATDYPDNRSVQPNRIYPAYFDILNRMDFTESEANQIARGNIESVLNSMKQ